MNETRIRQPQTAARRSSSRTRRLTSPCSAIVLLVLATTPHLAAAADEPQTGSPAPVTTNYQDRLTVTGRTPIMIIGGRPVNATALIMRTGKGETGVAALSLRATTPARPDATWTALAASSTVGSRISGKATALGLAALNAPNQLSDTRLELAAAQMALWSFTENTPLTAKTVPDPQLRARAVQLFHAYGGPDYSFTTAAAAGVAIRSHIIRAKPASLTVKFELFNSAIPDLASPQRISIAIDDQVVVGCTGAKNGRLTEVAKDQECPKSGTDTAATSRNASAARTIRRDGNDKTVRATWTVKLGPLVMLADGGSPPIVTVAYDTTVTTELLLSNDSYPSYTSYLADETSRALAGLPTWLQIVLAFFAFYVASKLVGAVDRGFQAGWKRATARYKPGPAPNEPPTPPAPPSPGGTPTPSATT